MNIHVFLQFIRLGRLQFLLTGFIPFSTGTLLAILLGTGLTLTQFVLGYATMAAAHLSVHYSNDYFDADADRFVEQTAISGGSGVIVESPELKPAALRAAIALMMISVLIGYLLTVTYAYPITFFAFVVGGNLIGWFYTAPPLAFVYRGLGEVINMITFGLLMPGAGYFVAKGTLDLVFFAFAFPLFLYGLIFILSVEIPDMEGDIAGKKPTFVVRKGRVYSFRIIAVAAVLATGVISLFAGNDIFSPVDFWPVALISFIPLGIALWGLLNRSEERACTLRRATANVAGYFLFQGMVLLYFALAAFVFQSN